MLTTFHLPIWSLLATQLKITDLKGIVFEVSPQRLDQPLTIFGRVESLPDPYISTDNDDQASPCFKLYKPNSRQMIRKMGYDLTFKQDLNFGKGKRNPLILVGTEREEF